MAIVQVYMCRRLAVFPHQGYGWSEYTNPAWVRPHLNGGAITVVDDNDVQRMVVDCDSDVSPGVYELATYDQTSQRGPSMIDKDDGTGVGTEIAWAKYLGTMVADNRRQNDTLELLEAHVYTQPSNAMNIGSNSYTDTGFRDDFELGLDMHVNGSIRIPLGVNDTIPENGDVVFSGVKSEGQRIMLKVDGTTSDFRVVGVSAHLLSKPRPGTTAERSTEAIDSQTIMASDMELWMSRSRLGYDLIGKEQIVDMDTVTACAGPDGGTISAYCVTAGNEPSLGTVTIAGAYTVVFCAAYGTQPLAAPFTSTTQVGDSWDGWWVAYITGTNLNDVITLSTGTWFDLRVYDKDVSSAVTAYYNDIRYGKSDGFLPT